MPPNCALLRLKPTETALAILFEMTDISVCEALRPENDVKNDMDLSFLGGGGGRRSGGLDVFEQLRLRGELLRNLRAHIVGFADPGAARYLRHLGEPLPLIETGRAWRRGRGCLEWEKLV